MEAPLCVYILFHFVTFAFVYRISHIYNLSFNSIGSYDAVTWYGKPVGRTDSLYIMSHGVEEHLAALTVVTLCHMV